MAHYVTVAWDMYGKVSFSVIRNWLLYNNHEVSYRQYDIVSGILLFCTFNEHNITDCVCLVFYITWLPCILRL